MSHEQTQRASAVGSFTLNIEASLCDQFAGGVPSPTAALCLDDDELAGGPGQEPTGTALDLTTDLDVETADYNFSSVVTTAPGDGFVAASPGHGSHVPGSDPRTGDLVGRLVSDTRLGLTNNACASALTVPFKFVVGTVDNTAGNLWLPQTVASATSGSQGQLETMLSDSGNATTANSGGGSSPANDGSDNDLDGTVDESLTTGTASGGTATTLVDAGAGWTVNAFAGKTVAITAGAGAPQAKVIASNTADTLTIYGAPTQPTFSPVPGATSVYLISAETTDYNGVAAAAERYPAYLNSVFDPNFINYGADGVPDGTVGDTDANVYDGSPAPVQPLVRYRGGQIVSGTAVELDLVIFSPGALAAAFRSPHPFSQLTADLGYTTITVLQNPTAVAAPSAITDFCAELHTLTTVWGEARDNPCNTLTGGSTAAPCNTLAGINDPTVPAGNNGRDRSRTGTTVGGVYYGGYGASLRDADEDGYENQLDTCAAPDGIDQDGNTIVDDVGEYVTPLIAGLPVSVNPIASGGSGTPASEVSGTLVDAGTSFPASVVGREIHIITGAAAGVDRRISAYSDATDTFTVMPDWDPDTDGPGPDLEDVNVPGAGAVYSIGFTPKRANPGTDPDADAIPGMDDPAVTNVGDPDGQLLEDTGCDTTPLLNLGSGNQDGDSSSAAAAWQNAGDNCALFANDSQADAELNLSYYYPAGTGPGTNPAEQGGPKTDGIGDGCEVGDADYQSTGPYISALTITGKCLDDADALPPEGVDADDDGFCNPLGPTPDPNDSNAAVTPEDYDLVVPYGVDHASAGTTPLGGYPIQVCNDGIDNDGDGLIDLLDNGTGTSAQNASTCRPGMVPPSPAPPTGTGANGPLVAHPGYPTCPQDGCEADSDGDGVTDEAERHAGTNPLGRCDPGFIDNPPAGPGPEDPPSDAWPLDFVHAGTPNSTDLITITDLTSYIAPDRRLNTRPGQAFYSRRWDVVPGPSISSTDWIEIDDLTSLFAGNPGFPPMTLGAKVFAAVTPCTVHPIFGE